MAVSSKPEHQVAFMETVEDDVREVQRYIAPPASLLQQQREEAAKRKDSRMLTVTFSLTVIIIFAVIVFSIWLSVEVGMNGRRIWSSGAGWMGTDREAGDRGAGPCCRMPQMKAL